MKKEKLDFIIKYTPIVLFFAVVLSVFGVLYLENYLAFFYHLSDIANINLIPAICLVAITYRSKLCFYNKVSAWSLLAINVINKFCQELLEPIDFELYVNIYAHFVLIPTTILVTYFLIKKL